MRQVVRCDICKEPIFENEQDAHMRQHHPARSQASTKALPDRGTTPPPAAPVRVGHELAAPPERPESIRPWISDEALDEIAQRFVNGQELAHFKEELVTLANEFEAMSALVHREADLDAAYWKHMRRSEFAGSPAKFVRDPLSFRLVRRRAENACEQMKNFVTLDVQRRPEVCSRFADNVRRYYLKTRLPEYPAEDAPDSFTRVHEYAAAIAEIADEIRRLVESREAMEQYLRRGVTGSMPDVEWHLLAERIEVLRSQEISVNQKDLARRIVALGYRPKVSARGDEPDPVERVHSSIRTALVRYRKRRGVTEPL